MVVWAMGCAMLVTSQATLKPGSHFGYSFSSSGIERYYGAIVPSNKNHSAMPLIVSIHGYDTTTKEQADDDQFGYLGENEGFVVVYPQGTNDIAKVAKQVNIKKLEDTAISGGSTNICPFCSPATRDATHGM